MKIEKNCVVALSYILEVEGKIADQASEDAPLEYIQGNHMLIPRFEEEVSGKEPGESFEFTLSPAEGYGEYREGLMIELPIDSFPDDPAVRERFLSIGAVLPLQSSDGQIVQGVVKEVLADKVKIDLNHPMAGKTLHFTGKVVSVRKATKKEIEEGLHGEFLPRQEGCHCGKGGCGEGGCGKGNCSEEGCSCGKEGCSCAD